MVPKTERRRGSSENAMACCTRVGRVYASRRVSNARTIRARLLFVASMTYLEPGTVRGWQQCVGQVQQLTNQHGGLQGYALLHGLDLIGVVVLLVSHALIQLDQHLKEIGVDEGDEQRGEVVIEQVVSLQQGARRQLHRAPRGRGSSGGGRVRFGRSVAREGIRADLGRRQAKYMEQDVEYKGLNRSATTRNREATLLSKRVITKSSGGNGERTLSSTDGSCKDDTNERSPCGSEARQNKPVQLESMMTMALLVACQDFCCSGVSSLLTSTSGCKRAYQVHHCESGKRSE